MPGQNSPDALRLKAVLTKGRSTTETGFSGADATVFGGREPVGSAGHYSRSAWKWPWETKAQPCRLPGHKGIWPFAPRGKYSLFIGRVVGARIEIEVGVREFTADSVAQRAKLLVNLYQLFRAPTSSTAYHGSRQGTVLYRPTVLALWKTGLVWTFGCVSQC